MNVSLTPGANSRTSRWLGHPGVWLGMALILGGGLFLRALLSPPRPPLPTLDEVKAFQLTDQQGSAFSSEALRGKVWVANFIFTRCPTICPVLTGRMKQVQRRTQGLGEALQLVSFTVDPEHDTPEVLRRYAERSGASPRSWRFLTGSREALQRVLVEGLKVPMTREGPADDLMGIGHAGHFVLVDSRMRVRGYYALQEPEALDRLVADAGLLANEG